jgi:hypothetical protein
VIPLVDVVGKMGGVEPEQIGNTLLKKELCAGLTVTFKEVVFAQIPALGVKVYVALLILSITAGLHVPEIPLVEVFGKAGAISP